MVVVAEPQDQRGQDDTCGWYVQRKPDHTAGLLSEICLDARTRLDLAPKTVGRFIRRSLHLDSTFGRETIDAHLDMALPPSAKSVAS
ncbi:hypothetical protein ACWGR4_29395 [Embleya sp. NPDC055664]